MKEALCIATLCFAAAINPLEAAESAAEAPAVKSVEIRVDDMAGALNFYCGLLLFEKSGRVDSLNAVSLSHDGAEILLKRASQGSTVNYESGAHVNLNLMVADIEKFISQARTVGIHILDTLPQQSQIGAYYRILDPAGNILHLIEPNFEFGDLSKPTVFNLGIQVVDMKRSREFYFATLGFSPLTEKYYPPVVPMNSTGIEMILQEGSNAPTAMRSRDETGISVVIELNNFDAVVRKLELKPAKSSIGRPELAVYDPDGNLLIITNSH